MITWTFISFVVCLILGVPIVIAIAVATIAPGLMDPSFAANGQFILRNIIAGANNTPLLALPLFILSGAIMSKGKISEKLFNLFAYMIGTRTGGIPCAVVVTCLFYGAISGSGPATCAAVGSMTIPLMITLGYDPVFCAALVACAAGLGTIIPPSIPFINYGVATNTSVADLFMAGIIPGILVALCLMVCAYIYCRRKGENKQLIAENCKKLRSRGILSVLIDSFWALLTPVIILGSIYSGIATPTEAAAISVFYAIIVSMFLYKTINIKDLVEVFRDSVRAYGPLCLMLALATAFGRVLALMNVPNMLAAFITENISSKIVFLIIVNVIFLILGMFIDAGPALIILAPMILPTAVALGIDPVHFGIIMTVNLCIGFVSPPFGMNLFVASPLVGKPVMEIGLKAIPFMVAFLAALILITYIPGISLLLVGS